MTIRRLLILRSVIVAALVAAAALYGCNIVGPAAYILHGPPRTMASYTLEDRPTVVFIDDRMNVVDQAGVVNPRQIRQQIAETVSEELMINELVTTTISPRDAIAVAMRQDRYNELLPIDAVGRAVGAEQVIYVEVLEFRSTPDGQTPHPSATVRVRVLDVVNRQRLFPDPEGDETARVVHPYFPSVLPELYQSNSTRVQLFEMMAKQVGDSIAKLFYEHETRELGGNLDPR